MPLLTLIKEFARQHDLPDTFCETADKFFAPLAESVYRQARDSVKPVVVGIHGCQGSGKSTLTDLLVYLLNKHYRLSAAGMSIDDFYLTKSEREKLAESVHPLLRTRGVPGTHDTGLMLDTLKALSEHRLGVLIPRFNKAIDDRAERSEWTRIAEPVDVILFEGWCVGSIAEDENTLEKPVNTLEAMEDSDAIWRTYANRCLSREYSNVFTMLDRLVVLKAPGFHAVKAWRLQQEQRLMTTMVARGKDTSAVMNEGQIERFIQHYERITRHSLQALPALADDLFELSENRDIVAATLSGEQS